MDGYFTVKRLKEAGEDVDPILEKRVNKYAARLNLNHFSQFCCPITELSYDEYKDVKSASEFALLRCIYPARLASSNSRTNRKTLQKSSSYLFCSIL